MKLEGSCHCGAVAFAVEAPHPYPFNLCYCNACRKTAGSGGFAINLGADSATLKISGAEHDGKPSPQERHFCGSCGTALWVQDPRWPDLVHPHAGAIDSELPLPPERKHLMLDFKPAWVALHADPQDRRFPRYPNESLAEWHQRLGLDGRSDPRGV